MSKKITVKRRIEKIRNMINDNITNSVSSLILHQAEDAKTLVRTILDLKLTRNDATAVAAAYHMVNSIRPAGTQVIVPSTTQALDVPASNMLIWEDAGTTNIETVVGDANILHIRVDTKGMRKMKENDQITLEHIASVASAFNLVGTVTLFFKE